MSIKSTIIITLRLFSANEIYDWKILKIQYNIDTTTLHSAT